MDREKAEALAKSLIGTTLDGWTIERYRNHGKSAAVFIASMGGQLAAVKVFDTELIERYGDQTQLERINRELDLRGHTHENLVSIYGGGYDEERDLYFVVMEFLDGPNLKEALDTIPASKIADLIRQLAAAARFLEDQGLVHRDIKPENIAVLDEGRRLVLLDLGVVRPIKGSSLTDPEGIQAFVGTLQYSSPEFLLREEIQDQDGWRALTFYQIGAVLHDLITKRPIFEKFATPYAKLVNAVQFEQPSISNPEVPHQLIDLARKCLLKVPSTRTRLLRWEAFNISVDAKVATARDRLTDRLQVLRAQADEVKQSTLVQEFDVGRMTRNLLGAIRVAARTSRASIPGLAPIRERKCAAGDTCIEFVFDPKADSGMPHGLVVRVCVAIIDTAENVVTCTGCAYLPGVTKSAVPGLSQHTPWFEGVLENVSLIAGFERFFFGAVDWCLTISPGVDAQSSAVFRLDELREV